MTATVGLTPVSDPDEIEVEAESPEQSASVRWHHPRRQKQKWGTITREGLVVGRGDNKVTIPPDDVYRLGALGCTDREIATWFGITVHTLTFNFSDYLAKSREEMKQRLRQAMWKNAWSGNAALQIFMAKNYLGMSDTPINSDDNQILPWSDEA
jgi:hypothetical protein